MIQEGPEILKEKTEEVSFSVEKDYVYKEAEVEISSSESDHEP